MKKLILLLSFISIQFINAANYGMFRLTATNLGYTDSEEAIFLLNSSGEIKFLENRNYWDVDVDFFFGEVTLTVETMGDEQNSRGILTLKDNRLIDGCAAYLDYQNESGETLSPRSFKLERWSKKNKRYYPVFNRNFEFSDECFTRLLKDYSHYSMF